MSRSDPYREKIIEDLQAQIIRSDLRGDELSDEVRRLERELREWRKWAAKVKKICTELDTPVTLPLDPREDPDA